MSDLQPGSSGQSLRDEAAPRNARRRDAAALALVLALGLAACQPAGAPAEPASLTFSAIPDQAPDKVVAQHRALMERVCAAINKSCRWVAAESYEALVDRFGRGEVDVAFFGAATFAQTAHRYQAQPLAMRDVDFRFTSVVVVPKDSPARTLADLKQQRFFFANRSSTSGHIMLRQRLADAGIEPERYFSSVGFAIDHDAAMRAVAHGEAEAAGVNARVYFQRVSSGDASASALRVVWQSAPFTDYVWAGRLQLPATLRQALTDAFLDLDPASAADRSALQNEGAGGFLPAFAADFDEAAQVMQRLGRL